MPDYVTRGEFEARVGVLEQEVDGEKLVTRHILEQTRRNGDDLASLKTRLERVEMQLGHVAGDVKGLSGDVKGLAKNIPTMMRETMRDVLKEQNRKR